MSIVLVLSWTQIVPAQSPPASPAEGRGRGGSAGRMLSETESRRSAAVPKVDVPQPVFPKRQLKFEVSERVEKRQTSAESLVNDPEYFEKYRYEATIVLQGAPPQNHFDQVLPPEQEYIRSRDPWNVFQNAANGFFSGVAEQILSEIPKDRVPADDIVWKSLLAGFAADSPFGRGARGVMGAADKTIIRYKATIYAPTIERAKQLAETLLTIYDNGVFAPLLKADETLKRQHQILLEEHRTALAEAEKSIGELQKGVDELKEYQDLSNEVLTNLTTQLWQITVEKAGIEARIRTAEKILAMKDDSPEIERIKTAAEIELAGLQAREAAVKDLVGKGRKRSELASELSKARMKISGEQQNAEQEEKAVAFYEDQLKRYQPFPVVANKVTIRPIKWEVTKATK